MWYSLFLCTGYSKRTFTENRAGALGREYLREGQQWQVSIVGFLLGAAFWFDN